MPTPSKTLPNKSKKKRNASFQCDDENQIDGVILVMETTTAASGSAVEYQQANDLEAETTGTVAEI